MKLQDIKQGRIYVVETSDEPEWLAVGEKVGLVDDGFIYADHLWRSDGPLLIPQAWRSISATVRLDTNYHRAEADRHRRETERHERILRDD